MPAKIQILFLLTTQLFLVPHLLCAEDRERSFYEAPGNASSTEQLRRGFYYYKDAQPEPEEKQAENKPKEQPDIPWQNLTSIPGGQYNEMIEKQLDYALSHPEDTKAVQDYMILQSEAVRRANVFQRNWGKLLVENPGLNPLAIHPTNSVARVADLRQTRQDKEQILAEMRENMAILFFTRAGCPYCTEQRKILNNFATEWNWPKIQEVDINQFPESAQDFGVQLTPDIFVVGNVREEVKTQRLAAGLTTGDQIMKGLMDAYSYWFQGRQYQLPQDTQQDEMMQKEIQNRMEQGREEAKKP